MGQGALAILTPLVVGGCCLPADGQRLPEWLQIMTRERSAWYKPFGQGQTRPRRPARQPRLHPVYVDRKESES
jgi:hypothetical protein